MDADTLARALARIAEARGRTKRATGELAYQCDHTEGEPAVDNVWATLDDLPPLLDVAEAAARVVEHMRGQNGEDWSTVECSGQLWCEACNGEMMQNVPGQRGGRDAWHIDHAPDCPALALDAALLALAGEG